MVLLWLRIFNLKYFSYWKVVTLTGGLAFNVSIWFIIVWHKIKTVKELVICWRGGAWVAWVLQASLLLLKHRNFFEILGAFALVRQDMRLDWNQLSFSSVALWGLGLLMCYHLGQLECSICNDLLRFQVFYLICEMSFAVDYGWPQEKIVFGLFGLHRLFNNNQTKNCK